MRSRVLAVAVCLCGLLIVPRPASAAAITQLNFSGVFGTDDEVALLTFVLGPDSTFSASTSSAAAGGFDTYLALFDSAGHLLLENDDRDAGVLDAQLIDPFTLSTEIALAAGTYTLALAQSPNFANLLLSDGFFFQNDPAFTVALFGTPETPCGAFVAADGGCRTGAYAGLVTLTAPDPVPVPEPVTLALLAAGLGCAGVGRLRRRSLRITLN